MVVRVRTGILTPPFNGINIWTDSVAQGRVFAAALPGYARASVEARVRVLDGTGRRILVEAGPKFFRGSSIDITVFYGSGWNFEGIAQTDARITSPIGTDSLIVEVRISSWAVAYGWGSATANIWNGCVTGIRVFSF